MSTPRNSRQIALAATAFLGAVLLAGCSTVDSGGDTGGEAVAAPGVTDTTITLGTIQSLTGSFAAGAQAQLAGAQLYWDQANEAGGVCDGRTVELLPRDHAYDPQKAVSAYSDIREQIFAIQLSTGTSMTAAIAPQMESDGMSAVAMSFSPDILGNDSILVPGTTYDVDMINAVDYLVEENTLAKGDSIGYIYFQGDFGGPGFEGATFGAEKHGITVTGYQIDPTVTDLTQQVSAIAAAGSKAIFISASPPLLANAAGIAATQGLDVPIIAPTPTFVPQLLDSPAGKDIAERVIVVSPYNAWSADDAAVTALRDAFVETADATAQQFVIAGYSAAKLMRSALDSACEAGPLTREGLLAAFGDVDQFAMEGLSVDLSYTDRSVPPSLENYILHADLEAEGGLVPLHDGPFKGSNAQPLLKGK